MVARNVLWISVLTFAFGACSSDPDEGAENDSIAALAETCHRDCEAQAAVTNCMQNVELDFCRALCDSSARDQPAECAKPYRDYYECKVVDGFECSDAYVAPKTTACDDLARALGSCQMGDAPCAGSDQDGTCPRIMCPCPSGPVSISGGSYESGSCVCFDTTTCMSSC